MALGSSEIFLIFFIVLLVALIPVIFYLLTLRAALKNVSLELRTTSPDNVFLLLIPLFNIIYQFILIRHVADSIEAELRKRGDNTTEPRPTYSIGIAYCILNIVGIIPIEVLQGLAGLAGLVCWIIHWVKVNEYKNRLAAPVTGPLDQNI